MRTPKPLSLGNMYDGNSPLSDKGLWVKIRVEPGHDELDAGHDESGEGHDERGGP